MIRHEFSRMKKIVRVLAGLCLAITLAAPLHAGVMPKRSVLGNGMVLLTSEQRSLPMVSIELRRGF